MSLHVGVGLSSSASSVPAPCTSRDRPPLNSCVTRLEPLHLSQRWKVENFASIVKLSKPGICLRSHVFRHASFPDACWQLCLYPGGKREENANNVSLFLKMSATTPSKEVLLKAEYRFYFMDDSDSARFSNVNIGDFHAKPPKGGHSWGLRNIPRQKVLNSLKDDGSLMVLCEIELIPDVNKVRCQLDKPTAVAASDLVQVPRSFVDGQRHLLRQGTMSDCTVEVVDARGCRKQFSVHKCLLTAHSDVFRAMFAHDDMRESVESRLVIEEFSPVAVHSLLEYIYTGSLDSADLAEQAEELIGLSEKYGLLHVKGVCQDFLSSRIDRGNLCQLLALADLYGADTLKQACVSFLSTRKKDVMGSDDWAELKECNPRLVNDVLETLLKTHDCTPPPSKRLRLGD